MAAVIGGAGMMTVSELAAAGSTKLVVTRGLWAMTAVSTTVHDMT